MFCASFQVPSISSIRSRAGTIIRISFRIASSGPLTGATIKRNIFLWAKRVGEACADLDLAKKPLPADLKILRRIADKLVFSKLRARTGGRLRFFVSGGAPLNPEIARFFFAAGLPVMEGYGLTETSPVITVNTPEEVKLGTVGKVLPGIEVTIADDGEILTRGPHVMKGYFKNPAATEKALKHGWFWTGDIAVKHPDGYIQIKDRSKDVIISGGENISSLEVEEVLYRHPAVMEAAVVARPDEKWGETPCAFVTLKPGAERDADEARIVQWCRDNLAGFKVPKRVVFGPLPKTSTGKIQKFVLRERARSEA